MIQKLEALVRTGQFKEASERLKEINLKQIPREEALSYASIANRIGQLAIALRILNPIVRNEIQTEPATDSEKIQYANLLRKLGAVDEAMEILCQLDAHTNPDVSLFLSYCHSAQWQYRESIPHLRQYLKNSKDSPYKISVAQVNLLAALIHEEDSEEALSLVQKLKSEVDPKNSSLLYGNILELSAQLEIQRENWDSAFEHLEKASELLKNAPNSFDALYIEKWKAVVQSLQNGEITAGLIQVRERALQVRHWETLRDCDFQMARLRRDRDQLLYLYFGTPYESYRSRIRKALNSDISIPASYLWTAENKVASEDFFDLMKCETADGSAKLPPGQALHRLLILLCQDFYKPFPLIALFSKLFPKEHFDPNTSPNRTHQVIKRLRQWFKKNQVPLQIESLSDAYRLHFKAPFAIQIPRDPLPLQTKDLEFLRLKALLPSEEFTARQAAEIIPMSRSKTQRLLQWAVETGHLESSGMTNKARYRKVS